MNKLIFNLYRIVIPKPVRTSILKKNLRKEIIEYYSAMPVDEISNEQEAVLIFLQYNPVTTFPYQFHYNYMPEKIEVHYDSVSGLYYVIQDGKKLFFRKRWSIKRIRRAYAELSREQDPVSPHRYLSEDFRVESDDVVADIGAAEGNFSLSVVEKSRKVYLIENNPEWIRALKVTFAPWKEKVVIINKIVSDFDDDKHIRIDTLMKENQSITFLKIDVDGNEKKVLDGARDILSSNSKLKIALCTYHKNNDERDFTSLLSGYGFRVSPSKGYMIFYYDKGIDAPWLRRALIRASR